MVSLNFPISDFGNVLTFSQDYLKSYQFCWQDELQRVSQSCPEGNIFLMASGRAYTHFERESKLTAKPDVLISSDLHSTLSV